MRKYLSSTINYLLSSSFANATEDGPICGRGCDRSGRNRDRSGFTLIELLIVVAVVGILATLVISAAQYAMRTARRRRIEVSCNVLKTALERYHAEYNKWPGNGTGVWEGEDNKDVLGPLRTSSENNIDGINFIDETTFLTVDHGKIKTLKGTTGDKPLVFQSRTGRYKDGDGHFFYYKVTINYEYDEATVEAPGFDDEKAREREDDDDGSGGDCT